MEKEFKQLIQKEIVPYLVGIRNDIAEANELRKENEEEGRLLLKGKPGKEGKTPVADKDFPSFDTVKDWVSEIIPKRGEQYFTDADVKEIVQNVFKLMPTKAELKGEKGETEKVDYSIVAKLATPLIEEKHKEITGFINNLSTGLLKAIEDVSKGKISPSQIIPYLESKKGSARLSAKAIKGLEEFVSTVIYTRSGGGGGGSSSSGGGTWGSITGTLSDQLDLQAALDLKANLASPTFTGTVVLPSTTSIGTVTDTEISYLDGVTSAIQTQINAKFTLPSFTAGSILFSDGSTIAQDNANFFIDNAANQVGFGVNSSLEARLNIKALGNGYTDGALKLLGSASGATYMTNAGGTFYMTNNSGADQFAMNSAGNVGIGTTTPGQKLTVAGNGLFTGYANFGAGSIQGTAATFRGDGTNSSAPGQFVIQSTGVSNENQFIDFYKSNGSLNGRMVMVSNGSSGDYYVQNGPSFTQTFYINGTSGNTAIGTHTNPGSLLSVRGNVTIGTSYAATAAPTNGLLVEGNVGIGITAATSKLHVVGTAPGTTGYYGVYNNITSAGANIDFQAAGSFFLGAGATGTGRRVALEALTNAVTSSYNLQLNAGIANAGGSSGVNGFAFGAGTGANFGGFYIAADAVNNFGVVGNTTTDKASGFNVAISGFANNGGASGVAIGGYFQLGTATPTFTSAALMADNGSIASPIFVARDNGTAVFTIEDGGNITIADAKNIVVNATTGTKIGTATTQKIGFYNATPVVQGASVADATGGAIVDAEARTAINALISRIEATGLIATV